MSNKSLHQLYTEHTGKVSDKWSLYLSEYDRLFNSYRDKPIRLLEIGIQNGGSLEIWSKFFKNASAFIGCDINPDCELLNYDDSRIEIIIGDANSPEVRERLLQLSPQFDIIVDDGSHLSSDIIKSFVLYFPLLAEGGVFIVEDLHCSYWSQFEGGLFDPYSSISLFKHLADVINHEHWGIPKARSDILHGIFMKYDCEISADVLSQVHSVEFINSMCVIRKATTTHNGLGNRVIAGSIELVVPRLKSKIQEPNSIFEQSDNPWSTRSKPPGEEIQLTGQLLTNAQRQNAHLNHTVAERDGQITNLNLTVAELDGQITNLNLNVAELNGQIANLNLTLAERDMQIIYLNKVVAEMYNSTSWRLTSPMRSTVLFFKRINNLIKKIKLAIQHSNGIINLILKTFFIFHKEGFDGIRNRLSIIQIPKKKNKNLDLELIKKSDAIPEILRIEFDSTSNKYVDYQKKPPISPLVKLIAFYLPQFHPFPENDAWWGKGFTEWTNVGKAQPNFTGHYQPHCPIHQGYYDLRIPEVMEEQAKLAKEYGVHGFSYYFYWFGGKVLMDKPLEMMLSNKNVDIPFCLTWANENWTRRWDGQENEILISQNHSDEDSLAFIRYLMKFFKDERYICVDGKPVLIIYRANLIPNIAATAKIWRNELILNGFPDLYLISAQTFGIGSPEPFDFDAAVQFYPHNINPIDINNDVNIINPDYIGKIYSYDQLVANAIKHKEPDYKLFRSAMLSWDNTARKKNNSYIFHNFSLLKYKQWLSSLASRVYLNPKYSNDEKLVFVNAWNEWAEGTHLEPDQKFGYGYLQTTYDVMCNYEAAIQLDKNNTSSVINKNECAVILHLYYEDLWSSIRSYLLNAFEDQPFDLYVSVTTQAGYKKVILDFPNAYVELVENRGRDILPFIRMLKIIDKSSYKSVCKIHSKRSIYRVDGDAIREEILNQLLGSKEHVNDIISRFKNNEKLGIVVPQKYLFAHDDYNMTHNINQVNNLAKYLKLKFEYFVFPAGSMFWFSPKSLDLLLELDDAFFDIELGLADGTYAHAIERLFCNIVKHSNYLVESC
jgi:lipopolysaccharide biosynthesis protein